MCARSLDAPGQALADFHIFKLIAEYWGCGEMFQAWESPQDRVSIAKATKRRSAMRHSLALTTTKCSTARGGIQWPFAETSSLPFAENLAERRLFEDGQFYHADGRARFLYEPPHSWPEQPSSRYPFVLLTGRGTAAQWHTQTRTSKSAVLRKLYPSDLYVEINPLDAQPLEIRSGDWVEVASQRGTLRARAFLTQAVQPGQLFIPMHYEETNVLTDAAFDPYSHQPAYKACAVHLESAR